MQDNNTDTLAKFNKRLHMQKKRQAVRDKLNADRDRKRRKRSNSANDVVVYKPKMLSLVDLCCGCGGQLAEQRSGEKTPPRFPSVTLLSTPQYHKHRS